VLRDYCRNLISPKITQGLRTKILGRKIIYLDTVDSTNSEGRRRVTSEAEGTVILSEQQTAGRGRLGRKWTSPRNKGIWMSILLKPDLPPDRIPRLTMVGAAAVCLALESVEPSLGAKVQIKWPNDLLIDGKKVGGILTEMQISGDEVQSVVLGIGLNVSLKEDDFPPELLRKATSLYLGTGRIYDREILIAEILNSFEPFYQEFLGGSIKKPLTICRQRSAVIGRNVILLNKGVEAEAEVLGLGSQGELVVKLAKGEIASVVSGEISLRML
jgi:BirA family biotin operon repressor/biotin-[acetyl-CoA-carboxylase] ligase